MTRWTPTTHGGYRRAEAPAQVPDARQDRYGRRFAHGGSSGESAAQIKQRTVARTHPPVLIRLGEKLGLPECPYVTRWRIETPFGSVRAHRWAGPDDSRAFHDHPWWFLTLVLAGSYTDRSPAGDDHLHAGSIRYRPALHCHTVIPGPHGAWTLLVTGPKIRDWGFWVAGKFRKANKYFLTYGHHPCQ